MYKIDDQLSQRISALRFPLIVMVVLIHNLTDGVTINGVLTPFKVLPEVGSVRILFSQILCRVAVPLLFLISSLLLYRKETRFSEVFRKKSKSLLVPYFIWNTLLLGFYLGAKAVTSQAFQSVSFANFTWIDWIDLYVGRFTGRSPFPLDYQFWFIRDLFVLSLLSLPIKKALDAAPLAVLSAFVLLWLSNLPAPFVNYEALLFFSLGYMIVKGNLRIESIDGLKRLPLLLSYGAGISLEIFWGQYFFAIHQFNILLGCVVWLNLSRELFSLPRLNRALQYLSGFAFFLFALHEPVLGYIRNVWCRFVPVDGWGLLLEYFGVPFVDVVVILAVGILLRKIAAPVFHILTGER